MEKLVEWLAGETEVLGENLPQCHFVHLKPHMVCPDRNQGCRGEKPATNRLNYGTASHIHYIFSKDGNEYTRQNGKYVGGTDRGIFEIVLQ
jgi:hypothetical protein